MGEPQIYEMKLRHFWFLSSENRQWESKWDYGISFVAVKRARLLVSGVAFSPCARMNSDHNLEATAEVRFSIV